MADKHNILAIHVTDRLKNAVEVQKVFTEFGCNIKTRVGLHDVAGDVCAPGGVVILELVGPGTVADEIAAPPDRHRGRRGNEGRVRRTSRVARRRTMPMTEPSDDRVSAANATCWAKSPCRPQALYGIHTARALENFPLAERPVHPELVARLRRGQARLRADQPRPRRLGRRRRRRPTPSSRPAARWPTARSTSTSSSTPCRAAPAPHQHERQRGAGQPRAADPRRSRRATTSASRRSTTSTCTSRPTTPIPPPCGWRPSACCTSSSEQVVALQEAFQAQGEASSPHVVKVGRTQLQDAVLTTLGREMGAYAEALNRDRWRIYKCEERLRVVNLGGTADRHRPRRAAAVHLPRRRPAARDHRHRLRPGREPGRGHAERRRLRRGRGHPQGLRRQRCSRSARDLRLLSSGPEAGLGEIRLPRAPGRLVDHAGQGQPGDPRGRRPGRHAASWATTRRSPGRRRRATWSSTPSCRWSPTACSRACDLLTGACDVLRAALRRGHRGRRGALPRARRSLDRRWPRRWCPRSATTPPRALVRASCTTSGQHHPRDRRSADGLLDAPSSSTSCSAPEAVCRLGMPACACDAGSAGPADESHELLAPQGLAPAHRPLRPPQRRQVEPAERDDAAAGLDRLRHRRHDHRPGREADGAAAARAGAVHRHGRHRRRRARWASCASQQDAAGLRPHRPRRRWSPRPASGASSRSRSSPSCASAQTSRRSSSSTRPTWRAAGARSSQRLRRRSVRAVRDRRRRRARACSTCAQALLDRGARRLHRHPGDRRRPGRRRASWPCWSCRSTRRRPRAG